MAHRCPGPVCRRGRSPPIRAHGRSSQKFTDAHATWLDVVDELAAAGLHLRIGVLDDNERSFDLATAVMDRARRQLDEVDAVVPRQVGRNT